jgi:hypothetical protein
MSPQILMDMKYAVVVRVRCLALTTMLAVAGSVIIDVTRGKPAVSHIFRLQNEHFRPKIQFEYTPENPHKLQLKLISFFLFSSK